MQRYFDPKMSHEEIRRLYPSALASTGRFRAEEVREALLRRPGGMLPQNLIRYCYRPFDLRWIYWEPETKLLDEKRAEYRPHVVPGNLWIEARQKQTMERFDRGYVTRELAESFNMNIPRGALVARVLPDTPASKSDLQVGDVIVKFNGEEIMTSSELPPIVGNTPTGTRVPVEVIRSGRRRTIEVIVDELPENLTAGGDSSAPQQAPGRSATNPLGVVVSNPTPEQKEQLQIEDSGVLVQTVAEGPAEEAGIRQGDVILMINNQRIANVREFEKLLGDLPRDKSIPVLIQRRGNPTFLALRIGDEGDG